jgi:hypothetical protein
VQNAGQGYRSFRNRLFVVFWDGEVRPFRQSVAISNHPSLFGHMNFLEFAFNTAREARTITENFVTT